MSKFRRWTLGAALLSCILTHRVQAFGGLWSSQTEPIRQSAERILFVDNADSTLTAVIQIEYAGPPQKFAWLIPVPGSPKVAVSSSTVFERLDAATAPQYWLEEIVRDVCLEPSDSDAGTAAETAPGNGNPADLPAVVMIDQGTAGPYDYVEIAVDLTVSDPAQVATEWLSMNGYDLSGVGSDVLAPYLSAGLNLLAFKLSSGSDVGAIRPVMLTYESELPMIPIRPTAITAQDDIGIQVWVIGPSQAVPDNYRSLVVNDVLIDWLSAKQFRTGTLPSGGVGPFGDFVSQPSNYDALITAAAKEAAGHGFVTELGGPASQYRERIWAATDQDQFESIANQTYKDGIDAILAANSYYASWDGWRATIEGSTKLPDGVTIDALSRDPEQYRGVVEVDTAKFLQLLAENVIEPVSNTAALFFNAPYLTRLYTRMSPDEMTVDPVFNYNADLAQVSPVHIAKQSIECSPEVLQTDAPWQIELPQGGEVAGEGREDWPFTAGSLPANLKVVALSTKGSGRVVTDNSKQIEKALFAGAGAGETDREVLAAPHDGVLIGGTQSVRPVPKVESTTANRAKHSDGDCSIAQVGAAPSPALAPSWLALGLGVMLALRWRRRRQVAAVTVARGVREIVRRHAVCLSSLALLVGCSSGDAKPLPRDAGEDAGESVLPGALTRAQLRDPETCKGCHPIQYREWSSSMHAYAARDPVFLAMNKRGQRETHGKLGNFCTQCHAPMAVIDGRTQDGLDLDQLPDKARGVSCYFCHNTIGVDGDHNGMLRIANDTTLRGPIRDPFTPTAHQAEFSETFEDTSPKSSAMCGGCHDILTQSGVHLERTFEEYRNGIFSKSATGDPPAFDSCVGCHMPGKQAFAAAVPGAPMRTVHEHLWPGVDVPLTDFPNRDAMRSAVEDCQLGAASFSFFTLEVTPPDLFTFQLETNAGHNQPSGAAQDRRMWVEFLAYDQSGKLLEAASSGNIGDGEIEEKPKGDPEHDPNLLMFRDRIYDARGKQVHMFWEAEKSEAHPEGYESSVLPVATTTYIEGKHAMLKQYRASGPDGLPARVTARLRMRPIGLDVLQDLVASGDLDPAILKQMPTLDFGAKIEWTPEDGLMKPVTAMSKSDCRTYRCLLDPSSQDCQ